MNTTLEAGFNAVALPFAITADEAAEIFGEGHVVMELTGDSQEGNEVRAHFSPIEGDMKAGKPYLVFVTHDTKPAMFKNKAIAADLQTASTDNLTLIPTTAATEVTPGMFLLTIDNFVPNGETPAEITNAANGVMKAPAASTTLKSYRAYVSPKSSMVDNVTFDNSTDIDTGIEGIEADSFTDDDLIYNLQGIRVSHPAKGAIYIVNGKKVVIK